MGETATEGAQNVPAWLIRLCKSLWKTRSFVLGTIILNIALGAFATWLFTPWSTDFKQLPIGLPLQNPSLSFSIFIILLLLTCIVWAMSRLPVAPSDKELRRRYLSRVVGEKENLALTGIPTGLIAPSVPLDEVFIPLQLRPHQTRIDLPLTDEQRKGFREGLQRGIFPVEIERVLIDAERNWDYLLKKSEKIGIADLWSRLTKEHPAAVIQGYPGMGKSTLMNRLTLHMARSGLAQPDPTMSKQLEPALIPIFLSLGKYASFSFPAEPAKPPSDRSLLGYLHTVLVELNMTDVVPFIDSCMRAGHCLVLLDGLDEVSDPKQRAEVQEAIRTFILDQRTDTAGTSRFNRFSITSRVAGYDQNAFPVYAHYTVAELTPEQISDFLPRWCRANVRRDRAFTSSSQGTHEETVAREAAQMEEKLSTAIEHHQGVRELAENPLLLTLLAVMQ